VVRDGEAADRLRPLVTQASQAKDRLLQITFTSLSSYLWLLRCASETLGGGRQEKEEENGDKSGVRNLLYLAAAVSDFYIPQEQLPLHKIQSSSGPPSIQLQCVPKMLHPLVSNWAGSAAVVSFKLETDPDILVEKARRALHKYGHRLVIGNILETRKREVLFVYQDKIEEIQMTETEMEEGKEIEEKIVEKLLKCIDQL